MRINKPTIAFLLSILMVINSITPIFALSEIEALPIDEIIESEPVINEDGIPLIENIDMPTSADVQNFTAADTLQNYLNTLDSTSANEVTISMHNYVAQKPVVIDDTINAKLAKLVITDCDNPIMADGITSVFDIKATSNVVIHIGNLRLSNMQQGISFINNSASATLTLKASDYISVSNADSFSIVDNSGTLNAQLNTIDFSDCKKVSFVKNKANATITTTDDSCISCEQNNYQCSYVSYVGEKLPVIAFNTATPKLLIDEPGVNFLTEKVLPNNTYIAGAFLWNNSSAQPTNSLFIRSIQKSKLTLDIPNSENHLIMTSDMLSFSAPDLLGSYKTYYIDKDAASVDIKWSTDSKLVKVDESTGETTRLAANSRGVAKVIATITPKADGYLDEQYRYKSFTITNLIELYDKETVDAKDVRVNLLSSTTTLDGYKKSDTVVDFSWDLNPAGNTGSITSISNNSYKITGASLSGDISAYFDIAPYESASNTIYAERFLLIPKEDKNGALLFDLENKREFKNTTVKFYLQSFADSAPISFEKQIDEIKFIGKKPKFKLSGNWKLNSYYSPCIYQVDSHKYKEGKVTSIGYDVLGNHVKFAPVKKSDSLNITNLKIATNDTNASSFEAFFDGYNSMLFYNGSSDNFKCKLKLCMSFYGYFGAFDAPLSVTVKKTVPKLTVKNKSELLLGESGYLQQIYGNSYGIINSIASISANSSNYRLTTEDTTYSFLKPGNIKTYIASTPVSIVSDSKSNSFFKNEKENIDLKVTLANVKEGNTDTFELSQKLNNVAGHVELSALPGTLDKNAKDYIYSKKPTIDVEPSSKIVIQFNVKGNDKYKEVKEISLLSSSKDKKLPAILGGGTISGNMCDGLTYSNSTVLGTESGKTITVSGAAKPGIIKILACFTMRDGTKKALPITINVIAKSEFSIKNAPNLTIDLNGYLGNNADMLVKGQKSYFKPVLVGAAYGETTLKDSWSNLINIDKMPPLNHKSKITVSGKTIYCSDKNFLACLDKSTGCISIVPRTEKIIDGTLLPGSTHNVVLQYRDACGNGAEQTVKVNLTKSKPTYKIDQKIDLYNQAGYVEKAFDFNILSKSAKSKDKLNPYKLSNSETFIMDIYKYVGSDNYSKKGCTHTTTTQPYFVNSVMDFAIDSSFSNASGFVITKLANRGDRKNKFTIALANGSTIEPGQYKIPFKIKMDGWSEYITTNITVTVK